MDENEDHRSEEETDAEALAFFWEFVKLIRVEFTNNGHLRCEVLVPVVEPVMDLSKIGYHDDDEMPDDLRLSYDMDLSFSVLDDERFCADLIEHMKKKALSDLDSRGIFVA